MTATLHCRAMMFALLLLPACNAPRPAAQPRASAEQAVQEAVNRYVAANNRGDVDALAALYADDAVLLPPDHDAVEGRAAIADFWRHGTDQGLTITTLRLEVAGELGYLVGRYTLPATEHEPADSGKYLMCLRRQRDGSWKLTVDIWNSSAAADSGSADGDLDRPTPEEQQSSWQVLGLTSTKAMTR